MRTLILLAAVTAFVGSTVAADLAGTYKGTWSSDEEGSGDLTMIFSPGDSGTIQAQVSFTTNDGAAVKCEVKSATVDGSTVKLVPDYEVNGSRYETTAAGTLDGKTLSGTYKTKALTGDSPGGSGTWKPTAI
jgi:hypothetical protein